MPACAGGRPYRNRGGRRTAGSGPASVPGAGRRARPAARSACAVGLAVAAVAAAAGCVVGCTVAAPRVPVLDAIAHPQRLSQPVSLARLPGPLDACLPSAAPAADHGACNVAGAGVTITRVRAAWLTPGPGSGYDIFLRILASQQKALATFMRSADNHEIVIVVGETPLSTVLVGGAQPQDTVDLPAGQTRAQAERLFRRLTGAAQRNSIARSPVNTPFSA